MKKSNRPNAKYPVYSNKQFERILRSNGFTFSHCRGSHYIWKRGGDRVVMTLHVTHPMICKKYIEQYNLKVEL